MTTFRAVVAGVALAGVFFAPPWLPLILAGGLALRFAAWEAVAVGLLIDLLYAPHGAFYGIPMPATLLMVVVVLALSPWRAQLALRR